MKTPDQNSYWVIPGRFAAGEYPGDKEDAKTRARLRQFLKAGVRCFVNLTKPDEKAGMGTLKHYATMLSEEAATLGVTAEHFRFPIQDVDVPETREQMIALLDYIDRALEAEKLVYVHCRGGAGRTGVVVGCYLVRHGMTGEAALKQVQAWWNTVPKSADWTGSPQIVKQCDFVKTWKESKPTEAPANAPATAAPTPDLLDRFRGCLLGLAVGDATGTTLEFKAPGTFTPITDMVGGGPFGLKPGEFTDDTSMALCLAASLIERKGFDPQDQMERYCRWWKEGYMSSNGRCFDIGVTVSGALREFQTTGNPIAGSTDANTAGNGSLMRLAAVPLFFAGYPHKAIAFSGESSKTTHGAPTCVDACRYFGGLIVGALMGASKEILLSKRFHPDGDEWNLCPEITNIADGSFKRKNPPAIKGTGYVVECLEAALWAFHTTDNFRDCILKAANLGNDADTTAAVAGQIAGAFYGKSGIPQGWLEKLAHRELIETLATQLHESGEARQTNEHHGSQH